MRRTRSADRRGPRPAGPDPRPGRRGARAAGGGRRGRRALSPRGVPHASAGPGCSACPTPRSRRRRRSRTRSTCRWSRSSRPAGLAVGLGRQRAHPVVLPARRVRHRRAARAAGCRTCSAASCSAPTACPSPSPGSDAAALTTRAVRDGDALRRQRHQGVDHPRRRTPTSTALMRRTSDDGAARHLLLARPRRRPPGCRPRAPERKMGLRASPTAQVALRRRAGRRPTG